MNKKSNRGGLRDPAGGRPPLDPAKKRIECKFTIAPQTKWLAQEITTKKGYKGKGRAVDEAIVLLAQKEGITAASLASEAEAKQPIRGALLLESGWVGIEYMDGYIYEKVFYNDDGYCRGFVKVDIKKYNYDNKPTPPSVRLVTFADGYDFKPEVQIPLKKIKTMADLNQLLGGLKDD